MTLPYYILMYQEARGSIYQQQGKKEEPLPSCSNIKELPFISPTSLLHALERNQDHPGYFPSSCWGSICRKNHSRVTSESAAIRDIHRLKNSSICQISRQQMALLSNEDLSKLSRKQVHIFSPIQLSALSIKQLSSVIDKLSLVQLRYSIAARPLSEVSEISKCMESSLLMLQVGEEARLCSKGRSIDTTKILELSPLHFKMVLSGLSKPSQVEVIKSVALWSPKQIEVVFPTLSIEEKFLLISHSSPKQKHVIRSCLTHTQAHAIISEGKARLREGVNQIKESFLGYDLSAALSSDEKYSDLFRDIERQKEIFFNLCSQISYVFSFAHGKKIPDADRREMEALKEGINSYIEKLKKQVVKET